MMSVANLLVLFGHLRRKYVETSVVQCCGQKSTVIEYTIESHRKSTKNVFSNLFHCQLNKRYECCKNDGEILCAPLAGCARVSASNGESRNSFSRSNLKSGVEVSWSFEKSICE
jgi:hypothetical protein